MDVALAAAVPAAEKTPDRAPASVENWPIPSRALGFGSALSRVLHSGASERDPAGPDDDDADDVVVVVVASDARVGKDGGVASGAEGNGGGADGVAGAGPAAYGGSEVGAVDDPVAGGAPRKPTVDVDDAGGIDIAARAPVPEAPFPAPAPVPATNELGTAPAVTLPPMVPKDGFSREWTPSVAGFWSFDPSAGKSRAVSSTRCDIEYGLPRTRPYPIIALPAPELFADSPREACDVAPCP
jgi:hypothetical protein